MTDWSPLTSAGVITAVVPAVDHAVELSEQPKEGPPCRCRLPGGDRLTVPLFAKGSKVVVMPYRLSCKAVRWAGRTDGDGDQMSSGEWVSSSVPYVVPRAKGDADAWQEEAAAKGGVGSQRIVQAGEVSAPPEVATLLSIGNGADVVVRQRIIYFDDQPTELTDTYYPVDVARGTQLEGTAKIRGGAVTLLAELGYTAHRVREEVSARMPTQAERQVLVLADTEPVLCMTRVTLGADGRPFQVDVSAFPASGQRLRYELEPRI